MGNTEQSRVGITQVRFDGELAVNPHNISNPAGPGVGFTGYPLMQNRHQKPVDWVDEAWDLPGMVSGKKCKYRIHLLSLIIGVLSTLYLQCNISELDCRFEDPTCNPMAVVLLDSSNGVSTPTGTGTTSIHLFASNALHPGNWGNRSTSSFACSSERTTYYTSLACSNDLALLSYPGDPMSGATGTHGVPAGVPILSETDAVIDTSMAALFDGSIAQSLNAAGVTTIGTRYWTGTLQDGSVATDHCNGWTDGTPGFSGTAGLRTSTNNTWTNSEIVTCDNTRHYICLCW
ncbi:MAG: hypothetical protein KDK33_03290 [Leptospiraceae bacterium]|nr:hypothetical protein [Leptospiraceae bacterium]